MKTVPLISSLSEVGARYDALLCDAWGVIHNGAALFPGAAKAMREFRAARGPVVILTNAPKPSSVIPPQLDLLGLPRDAYDAVVTSGDATRTAIEAAAQKSGGAPAYRLGPAFDDSLFERLSISFCDLDDAAFIVCSGLVAELGAAPEDYRDLLSRAAARNLPMVCANPDIVVNWGGRMVWCAGALAQIYEDLGGDVIYGGKPHSPIYDLAFNVIASLRGGDVARDRVLAVGDGLATDIKGANNHGVDAVLITGEGGVHDGGGDAASIAAALEEAGVHAVARARALTW